MPHEPRCASLLHPHRTLESLSSFKARIWLATHWSWSRSRRLRLIWVWRSARLAVTRPARISPPCWHTRRQSSTQQCQSWCGNLLDTVFLFVRRQSPAAHVVHPPSWPFISRCCPFCAPQSNNRGAPLLDDRCNWSWWVFISGISTLINFTRSFCRNQLAVKLQALVQKPLTHPEAPLLCVTRVVHATEWVNRQSESKSSCSLAVSLDHSSTFFTEVVLHWRWAIGFTSHCHRHAKSWVPSMRIWLMATWLWLSQLGSGHVAFAVLSQLLTAIALSVFLVDTIDALNVVFCSSRTLLDLSTFFFSLFAFNSASKLARCHDVFIPLLLALRQFAFASAFVSQIRKVCGCDKGKQTRPRSPNRQTKKVPKKEAVTRSVGPRRHVLLKILELCNNGAPFSSVSVGTTTLAAPN